MLTAGPVEIVPEGGERLKKKATKKKKKK